MDKESLTEKLLDLVEGRETPETWRNWWDEHETELEALLSRGEFLKLKPCRHGFQWVPVFGSQKGAIAILEKSGLAFSQQSLPGAVSGRAGRFLQGTGAGAAGKASKIQGRQPGDVSTLPQVLQGAGKGAGHL